MSKIKTGLAFLTPTLFLLACGGGPAPASVTPGQVDGPGPQLVVERFLQAANANDWAVMGQLFGTPAQTIAERDGATRAERHMQLLSSLLRHDDFVFRGRQPVPGRTDATNLIVEIVRKDTRVNVPFMVVWRAQGGWIIQEIQKIEELT